jgi:hypothetical protein
MGSAVAAGAAAPAPVFVRKAVASPTSGNFAAIACPAREFCLTVGYTFDNPQTQIAAVWQGSSWSAVASPPTGTSYSALMGIACVTVSDCTAVGYTYDVDTQQYGSLIEHWDGTAWSIVPSPNPGASGSLLSGVACADSTSCVAVGEARAPSAKRDLDAPLVERWDGTQWSVDALTAAPPLGDLNAVTCLDANDCVAVGQKQPHSNTSTLALRWDGVAWSTMPAPTWNVSEAILASVVCASVESCTAVGFTLSGDSDHTLVERWSGTRWRVVPGVPTGPLTTVFDALTCPAPRRCVAVGTTLVGRVYHTLVEVSDGDTWRVVKTPSPSNFDNSLDSVVCGTADRCIAVGETDLDTLVVRSHPSS